MSARNKGNVILQSRIRLGLSRLVLCAVIGLAGGTVQDSYAQADGASSSDRGDRNDLRSSDDDEEVIVIEEGEEEEGEPELPDEGEEIYAPTFYFADSSTVSGPEYVDCTLSGGTVTTCFQITVPLDNDPANHGAGPWCPGNIADDAEAGGLWPDDGDLYDVNGTFIENLADFYGDDTWLMYDLEAGGVNAASDAEECALLAVPDVDPDYQNYCAQCETNYLDEGSQATYTIPLTPVDSAETADISGGGVGGAFNGVRIDGPAPIESNILPNYTIAPFDDCGGHVNLLVGYHYHAVMGCEPHFESGEDGHAAAIGYALDGYLIHEQLDGDGTEPTDLDDCRGHSSDEIGYHYHVNDPGENQNLSCFRAETGCSSEETDGSELVCDASTAAVLPAE